MRKYLITYRLEVEDWNQDKREVEIVWQEFQIETYARNIDDAEWQFKYDMNVESNANYEFLIVEKK